VTYKPIFTSILLALVALNIYSNPSWNYYYEKGVIEYRAGMYDFAIENLTKALDMKGDLHEAANILADIYLKENNRTRALHYLSRSLRINDNQGAIHHQIADVYDYIGRFELAAHHYKRAVKIDPQNVQAHLSLVKYYFSKKDRIHAEEHFTICYTIGRGEGEKLYEAARKEEQNDNDEEALMLYQSAIAKCPVLIEAYFNISEIYRRRGDFIRAEQYLQQIKEIRPDYERAYINTAHLLFTRGPAKNRGRAIKRAIENLKRAIEINPKNSEAYILLSDIYRFIGEREKSLDFQKKAIEIEEPNNGE
jgi:tetratricopeptide (TPR) repeat protein